MRYILPALIFMVFSFSLSAQQIKATPEIVEQHVVTDLSDFSAELELPGKVSNTTNAPIEIKWRQTLWDQPFEWQAEISDRDNYYLADENGYTDNDYVMPLLLQPEETFDLSIYIYPNGRAGTATYAIDIVDANDQTKVLETMVFYINVSHRQLKEVVTIRNVKVFPNPARDYFELTPNQMVDELTIYNSIGQRIKTFAAEKGKKYDISTIPDGLYLVEMSDATGKTLKTVRLLKRMPKA